MKLSRNGRRGFAALLWIAVGAMLCYRGIAPFFPEIETTLGKVASLGLGVVVGGAKGLFVLKKSAARTVAFIERRPEKDWFWFSVHPILYALIPVMILMGVGLKQWLGESAPAVVCGVYVGIGVALAVGSRGFLVRSATESD